jgi:hypothetical protein
MKLELKHVTGYLPYGLKLYDIYRNTTYRTLMNCEILDYLTNSDNECIKPIPMNEYWLLRFGFVRNDWKSADGKIKDIDYFKEDTSCRVSLSYDCCKNGVHWFQNWYYFNEWKEL